MEDNTERKQDWSMVKTQKQLKGRILIMTAVEAERDAVLRGLENNSRFDVMLAGVGPASAAANTAKILANSPTEYDLVISAGIAGGFSGRADIGSLVIASNIISADLGAERDEGFISVDELGFGSSRIPTNSILVNQLKDIVSNFSELTVNIGSILTLTTVTGTAATAEDLSMRIPDAVAEAMEGFGVATAAQLYDLPVMEIRSISNLVGPRDKSAWRLKEALITLEKASTYFQEVF